MIVTNMHRRYLITDASRRLARGDVLPLDLYAALIGHGVDVHELERTFDRRPTLKENHE